MTPWELHLSVLYSTYFCDSVFPHPWVSWGYGEALMRRGATCLYAHTRSWGAPGSHGVWLLPLPLMLPVSWVPDVLGWLGSHWFEHLTIEGGRLSVYHSEYPGYRCRFPCSLATAAAFFPLQGAKLVLDFLCAVPSAWNTFPHFFTRLVPICQVSAQMSPS